MPTAPDTSNTGRGFLVGDHVKSNGSGAASPKDYRYFHRDGIVQRVGKRITVHWLEPEASAKCRACVKIHKPSTLELLYPATEAASSARQDAPEEAKALNA